MRVRGERECRGCGTVWSYYDTGSVACPSCGSLQSVGVDDRTRHTAGPAPFDLSSLRDRVDPEAPAALADEVKSTAREYLRRRGFIDAGELADLDDTVLAAAELVQAIDVLARLRDPTDDERLYVLDLLRGADAGERPAVADVPARMHAARGVAYAERLREYRREVRTWLDDAGVDAPLARRTLSAVDEHAKRVLAVEGDVPPGEVEALVRATRETVRALRDDEEGALATARDRLDRLDRLDDR
jgi:uncharacterized Zn finger protein (UPF0148 family)